MRSDAPTAADMPLLVSVISVSYTHALLPPHRIHIPDMELTRYRCRIPDGHSAQLFGLYAPGSSLEVQSALEVA